MVQAAPLTICRDHLSTDNPTRAVVFNSGNANAWERMGFLNARKMCSQVADFLCVDTNEAFVCSTGVIGVQLPMDAIERGIYACINHYDGTAVTMPL